jgi:signal transduction histidine kinase/streptogramin lyase
MWVGTIGRGLNRFDPETGRFTAYLHDPAVLSSLSNNAVDHLFVDHTGTIWVGTWDGLNRFDPASGRFVVYKRDWKSQANAVYGIAEDQDGMLWLGGTSGLQRFDPRAGKFTGYQHKLDNPNSISDNRVINVYVDHSWAIWTTTHNGLNKLDRKSGIFTRYYVKDGLPSNRLNCIMPDPAGHLWISTTEGLSEFDPRAKTFKNFSVTDGLPGMDLTGWSACAESRNGEMYFGGFSGGTAFYPEEIVGSTYEPPVVFTDFQLAGVSVGVGGGSPLKRSISYSQGVTLSHTQTMFALEFAGLSYYSQGTNRYRYKLDPLDSEWHEVGSGQRVVSYDKLPTGEYEFRVQGATGRGPWRDPGASLRIVILPPWWDTLWFRSISVLLVLLSAYAAHSYRIRQISQRFNLRMEARVEERSRIARDLHDTLLQSFHGLLLRFRTASILIPDRPMEARQQLESAIDQARQAITEGRDAVQNLRSSATVTNDLAAAIGALGQNLAAHENGDNTPAFSIGVEGATRELHPILRDEVYRIAAEALRNAFRHADAGQVEVEIHYGEKELWLHVRDDGRGMEAKVPQGQSPAGHFGMHGMRERAEGVGGRLEVWSELDSGTEVELTIPASIAYSTSPRPRRPWLWMRT